MRLLYTTSMVFAVCATLGQANAADMNYPNGYGQNGSGSYGSSNGGYGSGGYGNGGRGGSQYMGIRGTKSGDCYQPNKSRSFFDIFKRKNNNNFSLNCQDYNGAGGYAGHGSRGHAGNGAHASGSGSGYGGTHGAGHGVHSHGSAHGSAHGASGLAGYGAGGALNHDSNGNSTNGHVHNGHAGGSGNGHGTGHAGGGNGSANGAHSHGSVSGSAHGAGGLAGYGAGGASNHDAAGNSTDGHVHNGHSGNMGGAGGSASGGYGGFGAGVAGGYGAGGSGGYGSGGYGSGGYGAGGSGGYGAGGSGGYGAGGSGGYGAGGFASGWYLRGDFGYAALDLSKVDKQVSYVNGAGDIVYDGGSFYSADLDSSWSISGGFGYQVSSMFRVDATINQILEIDFKGDSSTNGPGYLCSLIDGVTDAGTTDSCASVDTAKFSATLGMANAYLDLGNFAGFTPYLGGGIGGGYVHWSNMNNDTQCISGGDCTNSNNLNYNTEFDGVHGHKSGWRFAYSAHAGASYSLTSNMKIDAGYSFTNISGGDMFGFASGAGVQGRHGDIQVHEVKAGIRYSFN